MKKLALGAMLALGLALASGPSTSYAAGDGLSPNARAQGNGQNGGMKRNAMRDSRAAMRADRRMMRHHRMMRRRYR